MSSVIVPRSPPTLVTGGVDHLPLVRGLARVLDSAFHLPGTRFRFGLDSVLGLLPVVGDAAGAAIGAYILYVAAQAGVPRVVLARMLLNLGTDAVVGAVPLVGDALDVAWKANAKNAALLERALAEPRAARRASRWAVAGLVLAALGIAAAGLALTVLMVKLIWSAF